MIKKRYPLLNDVTFNRPESHFSYRNSSGEEFAKAYVLITKDVQESAISQRRKQ